MRIKAPIEIITPYAEILGGFNYISTHTKILDKTDDCRFSSSEDNVIMSKTQLYDFAYCYGYGGGVQIGKKNVMFDIRCNYFFGGEAKYYDGQDTQKWEVEFIGSSQYDPNTLKGDDLDISSEPKNSRTDLLTFYAGVTVIF